MTRKKWIIVAAVGIVVVGVGLVAGAKSREPKGTAVRTAKVARKNLVSLITANGIVQAKTKVELSANIMGQITKLNVEEGAAVKKGDLLMVIDPVRYASAVDSARSGLESLDAELVRLREAAAQAKRDVDRAEQQHREGIIAVADFERARSNHEQALAAVQRAERQVAQARADVASARDALDKTEIRSPIDGIVTRRNVEEGEVVVTGTMNNPGTVLMTVSDMSTIEASLEVDQTDIPRLALGQPATVLIDAFPDTPFPAVVSEIGSSPIQGASALGGQATGTDYEVKVTLTAHPEGVRPGLTVTADITTATRTGALAVPIGALVLRPHDDRPSPPPGTDGATPPTPAGKPESPTARAKDVEGVYVVDGGKVAFRATLVGVKGELDVEIVDGLEEGQEIVVGPFRALRELKPGALVRVDNQQRGGGES